MYPKRPMSGCRVISITTKNVNVFVRMQERTKADEIVYCAFQLQAIRKHVAVQTNITKARLISDVGIFIKQLVSFTSAV